MSVYKLCQIDDNNFAVNHAVYNRENIFACYDWDEQLKNFMPKGGGRLLLKDSVAIGGVSIHENQISSPFLIAPFYEKLEFWKELLSVLSDFKGPVLLNRIPASHFEALIQLGAVKKRGQRRMLRPTSKYDVSLSNEYYFVDPAKQDQDEIVHVVYKAHLNGYTTTVNGVPDINDFAEAIERRFIAFSETSTLHCGSIIKKQSTNKIIAACLAGIYPDSTNNFSTIHQVSVLPEYRRKGLARAALLRSISIAHDISPVITLGVLVGNPAEALYQSLGFASGDEYSDYLYEK